MNEKRSLSDQIRLKDKILSYNEYYRYSENDRMKEIRIISENLYNNIHYYSYNDIFKILKNIKSDIEKFQFIDESDEFYFNDLMNDIRLDYNIIYDIDLININSNMKDRILSRLKFIDLLFNIMKRENKMNEKINNHYSLIESILFESYLYLSIYSY